MCAGGAGGAGGCAGGAGRLSGLVIRDPGRAVWLLPGPVIPGL